LSFDNGVTPDNVVLSGSTDFFTVVYVYEALANAKGFYGSGGFGSGCDSYPLAVGYQPSQVNATDFNLSANAISCNVIQFIPAYPVAEYVTGMNFTYVPLPPPP
jgi:hypothetical protein